MFSQNLSINKCKSQTVRVKIKKKRIKEETSAIAALSHLVTKIVYESQKFNEHHVL